MSVCMTCWFLPVRDMINCRYRRGGRTWLCQWVVRPPSIVYHHLVDTKGTCYLYDFWKAVLLSHLWHDSSVVILSSHLFIMVTKYFWSQLYYSCTKWPVWRNHLSVMAKIVLSYSNHYRQVSLYVIDLSVMVAIGQHYFQRWSDIACSHT